MDVCDLTSTDSGEQEWASLGDTLLSTTATRARVYSPLLPDFPICLGVSSFRSIPSSGCREQSCPRHVSELPLTCHLRPFSAAGAPSTEGTRLLGQGESLRCATEDSQAYLPG